VVIVRLFFLLIKVGEDMVENVTGGRHYTHGNLKGWEEKSPFGGMRVFV